MPMRKPDRMKKVVIKVLRDGEIKWVHFSAVPEKLYRKFFKTTESEPADLNQFLSKWCKQDFDVTLRMYKFDDISNLRKAIIERYEADYPELYNSQSQLWIQGWVKMWLSQHMKEEIVIWKHLNG